MTRIEPLGYDVESGLPIVAGRRGRIAGTWIVRCPYCGKDHGHGHITAALEHRVADCGHGQGYLVQIVEAPR